MNQKNRDLLILCVVIGKLSFPSGILESEDSASLLRNISQEKGKLRGKTAGHMKL